jgi:hypothetical protein
MTPSDDADRPRAMFRELRPEFQEQENGLMHVVYYTHATHHPSDVFAYGREAAFCFRRRRYLATITMASAMVEVILNKDSRMRRGSFGWRTLTMKLLREGHRNGLPIDQLFDEGETVATDPINFIRLRNKIAHGNLADIIGLEHNGTPDYSPKAREIALDHLLRAEKFEVEWYNTSPDVQERRIVHHRWPTSA